MRFPAQLPTTLYEVRFRHQPEALQDVAGAVRGEVARLPTARARAGTVAVGVGSRGIANLPTIVRAVVEALRAQGHTPWIVPAMGSHGGATASGQIEVLARLGVTEESAGAPIRATMEAAEIGALEDGPRLYQGLDSQAADYTILVSRIKPHTDFHGVVESGPAKMAVIGLGKQCGAEAMHAGATAYFTRFLAPAADIYAKTTNLAGAICLVENAREETVIVRALSAGEIGGPAEVALLDEARARLGRLPFEAIDVLVVREMGKNVSGTGFDTNVIGRLRIPGQPENFGPPNVTVLAVLDLTPETHGHAAGIGLADVTTQRLVDQIDWEMTLTNSVTAGIFGLQRNALPITMADDRAALEVAVRCCARPLDEASMVLIRSTLFLEPFWVNEALREGVEADARLVITGSASLAFDGAGVMTSPWEMENKGKR